MNYNILKLENDSIENVLTDIEEFAKIAIIEFSAEENSISYSHGFLKLIGHDLSDLQKKANIITKIIHPDDLNLFLMIIKKSKSLEPSCFNIRIVKQDNSIAYLSVKTKLVTSSSGSQTKIRAFIQDISDKVESLNKSEYNEYMFKMIIENSLQMIFAVDLEGKIMYCSPNVEKYLGYNPQEILGTCGRYLSIGEHVENIEKLRYEVIASKGEAIYRNYPLKCKNGSLRWNNAKVMYIQDKFSNKDLILGFISDITDKKLAEEKLEENNKKLKDALEYDKLRNEFLSNISHELRTPINIIYSALQLFKIYLDRETDLQNGEKIYSYIGSIRQNCFRLLRLINNLIDVTKLDAGFVKINKRNYDISNALENICGTIREYIESKDIAYKYNISIKNKLISCDIEKIERILLNLLSNATKFTKPGGTIEVNCYEKDNSIAISVKDNGVGIPKEKHNIIFEKFRQVHPLLTRNHEGSGIGLSIVKSLVEMHNGTISVISEENIGSEFIVEIPIFLEEIDLYENEISDFNNNYVKNIEVEFSDIYDL